MRGNRKVVAQSRRDRKVAASHVRRSLKLGELNRAPIVQPSPSRDVRANGTVEKTRPAPRSSGTGVSSVVDGRSYATVLSGVMRPPAPVPTPQGEAPPGKVRPIRPPSAGSPQDDGWKGRSFLERVSLAAHAAAGISKAKINSELHRAAIEGDAPLMKQLSSRHRANWILRSGSRVDAQLSFVGRALPPAANAAKIAALEQHRVDYSSPHETPSAHLRSCTEFVKRWARTKLVKPKVILEPPAWPSGSSCYERTSKKGGTLPFLLEKSQEQEAPTHYLSDAVGVEVAQDVGLFTYALKEMRDRPNHPRHRVTCITERGLKTRVVTVGPAWCQVLGHSVRKHLLRGLRSTPGAYQPLVGAKDEDLVRHFDGACGDVLVSTDLTRATDLLPLDLVKAVVDGLEASGRLTPLEIEILRVLTGPQCLEYPELGLDPITSARGILMGLPTSWCVLSLIHLYWLDVSKKVALQEAGRRKPRIRSAICGDDAKLATTVAGAAAYAACITECGGSPSLGKHYECSSGPVRRCVFLERLYEYSVKDGKLRDGVRFAAIPVKGLTSRNLPRDFLEDRLVSCRSFGLRQILCLDSLVSQNKILLEPCRDYMIRRCAWLPEYAKQVLGLIGGFPLSLGGFIFSPRPSDVSPAIEARDSGRSFSLAIQRELDPSWRMAVGFQAGGRELAIAEGELVDLPLNWDPAVSPVPPGWVAVEEDQRFLRTVLPIYRQVLGFSACPGRRTIHLRATDFVRSLKALRAEGRGKPTGLAIDAPVGPARILWRLPNRETPERGLSWYDATEFNRSAYETEVLSLVLENLGLGCYKGALSGALGGTSGL